jgi:hypothetical protein
MVATDRSETADRAVRWAANVAEAYRAELLLFQVLPMADEDEGPEVDLSLAGEELRRFAEESAGAGWRGRNPTIRRRCGWSHSVSGCKRWRQICAPRQESAAELEPMILSALRDLLVLFRWGQRWCIHWYVHLCASLVSTHRQGRRRVRGRSRGCRGPRGPRPGCLRGTPPCQPRSRRRSPGRL